MEIYNQRFKRIFKKYNYYSCPTWMNKVMFYQSTIYYDYEMFK